MEIPITAITHTYPHKHTHTQSFSHTLDLYRSSLTRMAVSVCVRLDKLVLTVVLVCFLLLTALYQPARDQFPHSLASLLSQDTSDGRLGKIVSFPMDGVKDPYFHRKKIYCNTIIAKDKRPKVPIVNERMLHNCSVRCCVVL